jgi:hypothetical protein
MTVLLKECEILISYMPLPDRTMQIVCLISADISFFMLSIELPTISALFLYSIFLKFSFEVRFIS